MPRVMSKETIEFLHRKPKRKIIQIEIVDFKMGEYASGYVVALCNDGTLWKHIDPGKDVDEPEEWYKLKEIPQPRDDDDE